MRWTIEQDTLTGRFIIVNSRDQDLLWGGSSWLYRDQSGGTPLINFPDRASAEQYGVRILGEAK
jgi:hypothetical protein